ncbi:SDR family oxidoreductase [Thalassoroseus pseudoceratinae]|uniref:SDR family oxidoreductase n=1 Tax=Thalassoroseus pseudoceratinae TaxID=2713176 RepID=UPI0014215F3D|nr:SDR family oxidoreductase [Thalassoroseus pseudoceratinae]
MRKLIVGCGYVGRRVAKEWLEQGDEVFAVTRSESNAELLRSLGVEPIIADVTQPETLTAIPPIDTLLYAVSHDRSAGYPPRVTYVEGLNNFLKYAAHLPTRMIFVSSTSVYGVDDGSEVDEDTPTAATTESGRAYVEAETDFWRGFWRKHQDSRIGVVLRSAGIYGPDRLLRRVASLRNQDPIPANPDGWLNLIHVDDLVQAILKSELASESGTVLVCDDRPIQRREYYTKLAELVGASSPVFNSEGKETSLGKRCNNRLLREKFGLELRFPTIDSGLPHAVDTNNQER